MNKLRVKFLLSLLAMVFLAMPAIAADNSVTEDGPDPTKLVGRWQRTDGGYILQLSEPALQGQLQAEYFNPKPINVAQAEWKHQDGYLGAFVKLQAPNYPGSTYTLAYDSSKDLLVGIYYHAGLQQQFRVEFERIK